MHKYKAHCDRGNFFSVSTFRVNMRVMWLHQMHLRRIQAFIAIGVTRSPSSRLHFHGPIEPLYQSRNRMKPPGSNSVPGFARGRRIADYATTGTANFSFRPNFYLTATWLHHAA